MHAIDFSAFARVVTHESRHLNPRQPHFVSEVFATLSEAASCHGWLMRDSCCKSCGDSR